MATAAPETTTPDPTTGRIVQYTLTARDVERIDIDRRNDPDRLGNIHSEGDVVPLLVIRAWPGRLVNGQAYLDGNDNLWITSAAEGDGIGTWHYPAKA